jgi:dTDP-4-amino-4,6-dideoxygalactose transaminase
MKQSISDLGIFGGIPAFSEKMHVGRPNILNRQGFIERISRIFDNKWLTNNGPFVQEFEQKISELTGARHCIAMCNGTVALEIAIRALGMTGEVIIPSATFIATAHALQWQAITPVFCDIDEKSHTLDPKQIERMITPRTTGIIGVHLWGRPCDTEAIEKIAREHDLKVLYDAAHAFSCRYNGRMIGNFGDAEVFSFHATKFVNTFEGGAVVTNDDDLALKMRLMKNFGFKGYDNVIYIGTNGKMSEVSAAMGLASLDSLDEVVRVNRDNYLRYRRELEAIPGILCVAYDEEDLPNYQYVILEIDENRVQLSRDQIVRILQAENILARRYFYPGCHKMEPYKSYFPHAGLLLPMTEKVLSRVMSLPTGTSVTHDDIRKICELLRCIVTYGKEIKELLKDE